MMDSLEIARKARDLALAQALNDDERDEILDRFLAERERCVQMSVDALMPEIRPANPLARRGKS